MKWIATWKFYRSNVNIVATKDHECKKLIKKKIQFFANVNKITQKSHVVVGTISTQKSCKG